MVVHSPLYCNQYGSFEEFLESVQARPKVDWRKGVLQVPYNQDIQARIAILNWMLDRGLDLSARVGEHNINILHTFFRERKHDIAAEASLLQRMLDAGADINLRSMKSGLPLGIMFTNSDLPDEEMGPWYDVIFSRLDVDWGAWAGGPRDSPTSLRQVVERLAKPCPEANRRLRDYLVNGPSPRPVFD